jgi:hypothetical protein
MKKKNFKKWKHHGLKKYGPPSQKQNSNFKLNKKIKKMFRMNYDGK